MKFSYSPWLSALTVATTAATVTMVNVSSATAASMKYDLQINGIEVESPLLGGLTTINVEAGSFTTNDSMDAIESVSLKLGEIRFDQGDFVSNGSQTDILFSTPSQSLTLFDILPLPQEIGGMATGGATLSNGGFSNSVSYKLTKVPSVPEPLTLLGSAAALGFGVVLKQEHSRKKNKVNE